jgi:hypothetical protein
MTLMAPIPEDELRSTTLLSGTCFPSWICFSAWVRIPIFSHRGAEHGKSLFRMPTFYYDSSERATDSEIRTLR